MGLKNCLFTLLNNEIPIANKAVGGAAKDKRFKNL